jgi:hypothetical protein
MNKNRTVKAITFVQETRNSGGNRPFTGYVNKLSILVQYLASAENICGEATFSSKLRNKRSGKWQRSKL